MLAPLPRSPRGTLRPAAQIWRGDCDPPRQIFFLR